MIATAISSSSFSQKNNLYAKVSSEKNLDSDTIITYYIGKKKTTLKDKAKTYEVMVKKSDSLWLLNRYLADNHKLIGTKFYLDKGKKVQTGQQLSYNLEGKTVGLRFFNKGKKVGINTRWFDDGKVSYIGEYSNGKQSGSWKFYHTNGNVALEKMYVNGEVLFEKFFDEKGMLIPKGNYVNRNERAFFKGGKEKYHKKITSIKNDFFEFIKRKRIGYGFKGKVVVRYIVGVTGKVTKVYVDDYLPKDIKVFLVDAFMRIKGWNPQVHRGRKVPKLITQTLNISIKKR